MWTHWFITVSATAVMTGAYLPGIFVHGCNFLCAITLYPVDIVCKGLVIDSGGQVPQAQVTLSHTETHTELQVRTYTCQRKMTAEKSGLGHNERKQLLLETVCMFLAHCNNF